MGDPYGCNCDIEFRKLERKHEEDLKAARAEGFEQGVKEMTSVMGSDQTDVAEAARKAYDRDLGAMKEALEKEVGVKISKARDEVKWAESRAGNLYRCTYWSRKEEMTHEEAVAFFCISPRARTDSIHTHHPTIEQAIERFAQRPGEF